MLRWFPLTGEKAFLNKKKKTVLADRQNFQELNGHKLHNRNGRRLVPSGGIYLEDYL